MLDLRHGFLGAFTAGAAVLVVGSAAYACVPFVGDLTVTGPTNGNLVTGDGSANSHVYCTNREPTTAAQAGGGDTITVTVAAATACTAAGNKLASGNNSVIINNSSTDANVPFTYSSSKWNFVSGTGCFRSPAPSGNKTLSTTFSVSAAGAATGNFVLPTMNRIDPTNMASAVCVGKSGGTGIFAPIRITSI